MRSELKTSSLTGHSGEDVRFPQQSSTRLYKRSIISPRIAPHICERNLAKSRFEEDNTFKNRFWCSEPPNSPCTELSAWMGSYKVDMKPAIQNTSTVERYRTADGVNRKIIETWERFDEHRKGLVDKQWHALMSNVSHFRGKSQRNGASTIRS